MHLCSLMYTIYMNITLSYWPLCRYDEERAVVGGGLAKLPREVLQPARPRNQIRLQQVRLILAGTGFWKIFQKLFRWFSVQNILIFHIMITYTFNEWSEIENIFLTS